MAWRQIEDGERRGAREEAPALLDSARICYDSALRVIGSENDRWFLLREYAPADSHLVAATRYAFRAINLTHLSRQTKLSELRERIDRAETRLRDYRLKSNHHLMRMSIRRSMAVAEVELASAAKILSETTLTATQFPLENAEEALATVGRLLEDPSPGSAQDSKIWRRWVNETVDWTKQSGSSALVVVKRQHKAYLITGGKIRTSYPVELGYGSAEGKRHAGDAATPEGIYQVTKVRPKGSRYYKALNLDYPNEEDKARFKTLKKKGQIPLGVRIGGNIEIHGHGGRGADWTNGCIALTNDDIDRLMPEMTVGSRVTIVRNIEGWPK